MWTMKLIAAFILSTLAMSWACAAGKALRAPATGLVYHPTYLQHITGPGHPERPERLTAIIDDLDRSGLLQKLTRIQPRAADLNWVEAVHTPDYVNAVKKACAQGVQWMDSPDTPICSSSYDVALLAVGGVLAAIDAVMAGTVSNAFCAVRPPGHHATANKAMGFCLFNNVAIGARYVQKRWHAHKVLIVDWDVHHGNGTQQAFYSDPSVLYFSVHRFPFYPGTGAAGERGAGDGLGYIINVPLPAASGDEAFITSFRQRLVPAADDFRPNFILISAGFDAHRDDPLGGMRMSEDGYAALTRIVMEIAGQHCNGRLVSVLEGGYNLQALARCVRAHLLQLLQG